MKRILIPESTNVFALSKEDRDVEKIKEALNTILNVIGDLNLTVEEFYTFIDLIIAAFNEKEIKF